MTGVWEGSLIQTLQGKKLISDIEVGDLVIGFGKNELTVPAVNKIYKATTNIYIDITASGRILWASPEQLIVTKEGFKLAKDVKQNDWVLVYCTNDVVYNKVDQSLTNYRRINLISLETNAVSSYFAQGIGVNPEFRGEDALQRLPEESKINCYLQRSYNISDLGFSGRSRGGSGEGKKGS